MKAFASLLDRLTLTPQRNGKIRLMVDYMASVPDPERGYGVAAITRDLSIASVKPAMLRALMAERMDEVLRGMRRLEGELDVAKRLREEEILRATRHVDGRNA